MLNKMFIQTLDELETIINDNLTNLLEVKVPEHPPDRENIKNWLSTHDPEEDLSSYQVAVIIANNIKNVSYEEIVKRFNDIANELFVLSVFDGNNLYIYSDLTYTKSNFYFTLLFYYICTVQKGIKFTGVVHQEEYVKKEGDIVVIVDDASYSGDQVNNIITDIITITDMKEAKFFLSIPYISEQAKRLFLKTLDDDKERLIVPESSETFIMIQNYIENDIIDSNDFFLEDNEIIFKHLLYLDFKLPDWVSVPQTVFAYGYHVLDEDDDIITDKNDVLTLISGCSEFYKNHIVAKGVVDIADTEDMNNFDKLDICPSTFYKKIHWRFRHN